jgi:hypothetical protein
VVVSTLRVFHAMSENIPTALCNDDLLIHSTYEIPSLEVRRIVLPGFTDIWDGEMDGILSGFQSLLSSFRDFFATKNIMEDREDGFYNDAQGI